MATKKDGKGGKGQLLRSDREGCGRGEVGNGGEAAKQAGGFWRVWWKS